MSRSTPASPNAANDAPVLIAFLAVAATLLAAFAWDGSLLASDDAIYAQVAREVLADGRFPDLTWQGRPFLDKGPLLFWALAGSQAVFGPTMLALRLPGILAGLGVLLALFCIARRAGLSRSGAVVALAFVLGTSAFFFNARRPMTDMPGLAFGLAGFWALAFPGRPARAVLGGIALGLAALAKLVAPAPFVLALLALQAWAPYRRPLALATGLVVAALVALPWHVAMVAIHGRAFVDVYLAHHVLARAARVLHGEGAGVAYASWILRREWMLLLPAVVGVIAGVVAMLRSRGAGIVATLLLASGGLPLAVSSTGLPHYLVQLLPGVALGLGTLVDLVPRLGSRIGLAVAGCVLGAAFVVANGRDMLRPEYGAGSRAVCDALIAEGLVDRVAGTWDLHDPTITWYCGRAVTMYVDNPGVIDALRGIPMLEGWVVESRESDLRTLAARGAILVTYPEPLDSLRQRASEAGVLTDVVANAGTRIAVQLSARLADAPAAAP